jgi:hypothetical protein
MIKYTVWNRYRVNCPNEKDKEWNLVPNNLSKPYQWGYDTYEEAAQRAQAHQDYWQPGVMAVVIREIELPD